jgi:hypothetical protein
MRHRAACDTEPVNRIATSRISRRDWIGDAILTLICGGAALAAVFLPWANTDNGGSFNAAATKPSDILGVLQTEWGWKALALAVLVIVAGVLMIVLGPRRHAGWAGVFVAVAGVAMVAVASDAQSSIGLSILTGIGLIVTLFAGVLLVPIGLASSAVAWVLRSKARQIALAAAPPVDHSEPTGQG